MRIAIRDLLSLSDDELYYLEDSNDDEFRKRYASGSGLHGAEVSSALREQLSQAQRGEDCGDVRKNREEWLDTSD